MKFKVGQRVIWTGKRKFAHLPFFKAGDAGTITHVGEWYTNVKWDKESHNATLGREFGSRLGNWSTDGDSDLFDPEELPLDLDRRIRLRGGSKVGQVLSASKNKSKLRPLTAKVKLHKLDLVLTYCRSGQFYPGFDQPIDLVNK